MNPIFEAAWEFELFLDSHQWDFCFIGGLAVQRWGKPRFTADADLTLITGFGDEGNYIDLVLAHFQGRLPDARRFALESRVLLVQGSNEIPVDISLGALPFEKATVERASRWKIDTQLGLTTCSAEDLIVHKCFANRAQDWLDIETIIHRQPSLDDELILRELKPLADLKKEAGILDRLQTLFQESEGNQ